MLDTLDLDLATAFLSFDDVVAQACTMGYFCGQERWHALVQVRKRYSGALERLGLDDAPSRRRQAILNKSLKLLHPATHLLLMGCVDLDKQTKNALDAWLATDGRSVTALMHAPESVRVRFDQYGVVVPSEWRTGAIGDINVVVADDPSGQAACVASAIDDLEEVYAIEDIVVGVPDTDVVPEITVSVCVE